MIRARARVRVRVRGRVIVDERLISDEVKSN